MENLPGKIEGTEETKAEFKSRLSSRRPPSWREFVRWRERWKLEHQDEGTEIEVGRRSWAEGAQHPDFKLTDEEAEILRIRRVEGGEKARKLKEKKERESTLDHVFKDFDYRTSDPLQDILFALHNAYKEKVDPKSCPSPGAYLLWQHAKDAPKVFMGKFIDCVKPALQEKLKKAQGEEGQKELKEVEVELEAAEEIRRMVEGMSAKAKAG